MTENRRQMTDGPAGMERDRMTLTGHPNPLNRHPTRTAQDLSSVIRHLSSVIWITCRLVAVTLPVYDSDQGRTPLVTEFRNLWKHRGLVNNGSRARRPRFYINLHPAARTKSQ